MTSTIISPQRRVAQISGEIYSVGQMIDVVSDKESQSVKYKLIEVEARRAVLEAEGQQYELTIPEPGKSGKIKFIGTTSAALGTEPLSQTRAALNPNPQSHFLSWRHGRPMKTTGRFALFAVFAAAGVGLAICIGTSANLFERKQLSSPVESAAIAKVVDHSASAGKQTAAKATETGVAAPVLLPPPPDSMPVEAHAPYAQQVAPPADGELPQEAVDTIRNGLTPAQTAPQLPPPTPPPPTAQAMPVPPSPPQLPEAIPAPTGAKPPPGQATVDTEGDGKLRIHISNADIHDVLQLLSEQGNLNILASKSVRRESLRLAQRRRC